MDIGLRLSRTRGSAARTTSEGPHATADCRACILEVPTHAPGRIGEIVAGKKASFKPHPHQEGYSVSYMQVDASTALISAASATLHQTGETLTNQQGFAMQARCDPSNNGFNVPYMHMCPYLFDCPQC